MKTKIYNREGIISNEDIDEIIASFKAGKNIAFKTETVYGLGGDIFNRESIENIYKVKGRPLDNPLIVHIGDIKCGEKLGYPDLRYYKLAKHFWPGPLTMIIRKKEEIETIATCGLDTIAIRMPNNEIIEEILKRGELFIGAPSSNLSGSPSPTKFEHVYNDLNSKIAGIIDDGECEEGIESTIIDLVRDIPVILRPGTICKSEIEEIIGEVCYAEGVGEDKPIAPGMKYKHYSPEAEVIMFNKDKINELIDLVYDDITKDKKIALYAFADDKIDYFENFKEIKKIVINKDIREGIKYFYDFLRKCDSNKIDIIYVEKNNYSELGNAFLNRLEKSAEGKEI